MKEGFIWWRKRVFVEWEVWKRNKRSAIESAEGIGLIGPIQVSERPGVPVELMLGLLVILFDVVKGCFHFLLGHMGVHVGKCNTLSGEGEQYGLPYFDESAFPPSL